MNEELHEFVTQLSTWHANKIKNLRGITEATGPFTLEIGDESSVKLTKRESAIFRAGIETALIELGDLPFTLSESSEDEVDGNE